MLPSPCSLDSDLPFLWKHKIKKLRCISVNGMLAWNTRSSGSDGCHYERPMMTYSCNPSTWLVEVGASWVQGHPQLCGAIWGHHVSKKKWKLEWPSSYLLWLCHFIIPQTLSQRFPTCRLLIVSTNSLDILEFFSREIFQYDHPICLICTFWSEGCFLWEGRSNTVCLGRGRYP